MDIPYENIDPNIRDLVRTINRFPGIETEFSCEGHSDEEGEEAYVAFSSATEDCLRNLLGGLPLNHSLHWADGSFLDFSKSFYLNDQGLLRYKIGIRASSSSARFRSIDSINSLLLDQLNLLLPAPLSP